MSLFSRSTNNKLIELQNLLFNENSTKLKYSSEDLFRLAQNRCNNLILSIEHELSITNSSIIPATFFTHYDRAVLSAKQLAKYENYVKFSGVLPNEKLAWVQNKEAEFTHAMILRLIFQSCQLLSALPIYNKDKAYSVFSGLFSEVRSRLSSENSILVENDCRRRIAEAIDSKQVGTDRSETLPNPELPILNFDILLGTHAASTSNQGNVIQKDDELLPDAVRLVIENRQASISMLQRRLCIGYSRAGDLIDCMEQRGYITKGDGAKPRNVLITAADFNQLFGGDMPTDGEERKVSLNCKTDEEKQLFALFEEICENEPVDNIANTVDDIEADESNLNTVTDYPEAPCFLKNLDNYVIPKSDEDVQIRFIDNIVESASPREIRLILICDSLALDAYEIAPHLFCPIVSDTKKAMNAIRWLRSELDARKNSCAKYLCRNIESYNDFVFKYHTNESSINVNKNRFDAPDYGWPHLIIIVNEFYNLKDLPELDQYLMPILLHGKQFGIHFFLFSKFSTSNLSLGAKADLLKVGNADDLNDLFSKNDSIKEFVGIDEIDNDMNGLQFEKFCGELLRKNGFSRITVTQSSADYGADVVAYKDDIKYAIQCKKYTGAVGISAVQEVIASKSMYDCHVAVVLTNSSFTSSAINLANKNGVLLWGRDKLLSMMSSVSANNEE